MKRNRLRDKWKKAFAGVDNNRGSAMITALVVGLVILAFCLSTLMVSYTLYAQTNRQTMQLQVKNMAQSFSETLQKELEDDGSELRQSLQDEISTQLGRGADTATVEMELKAAPDATDKTLNVIGRYDILVTFSASSASRADAVITCRRSDSLDRDMQSYSIEKTYELK